MKKLIELVEKMAHPTKKKWIVAGYFIGLALLLNPIFGTNHLKTITDGLGMIDMHAINMPHHIYDYIQELDVDGQEAYTLLLGIDVFFLIVLACLQLTLFHLLMKKTLLDQYMHVAIILVIGRVVCDMTENCLMLANIHLFPSHNKILLWMTSTATATKWLLLIVSIIMLLGLLALMLINKIKGIGKLSDSK